MRTDALGRKSGYWIPAPEVELYLAQGWSIADDAAGFSPVDDCLLLAPPPQQQETAA